MLKCWKPHGRTSLCWSFYYISDNAKVDLKNIQIMHCILCYQTFVCGINPRTQMRKGLISCYKTYGITSFFKNVDANHMFIAKKFEEEVNCLLKEKKEKQSSKKRTNLSSGSILKKFM
jgi:hypothetical protein